MRMSDAITNTTSTFPVKKKLGRLEAIIKKL